MSELGADPPRPRPRPHPRPGPHPAQQTRADRSRRRPPRALAVPEQIQAGPAVANGGNAIVIAARVGRLLGRSGWRIARQLPGVNVVEQRAQKLRQSAATETFRLLETPEDVPRPASAEERRVMMLVQDADADPAPLRTAMSELLERSAVSDDTQSRDYLFGTIISQLVPDEARILAALGGGATFAAVDVVCKQVGRSTRVVLSNASTIGRAASVSRPQHVGTYLTRLDGYGLLEFGRPDGPLDPQFSTLAADATVRAAQTGVGRAKLGSSKIVRKSVRLSPLGAEFWTACAPGRPELDGRTS